MSRVIKWTLVWLFACFTALVCIAALVRVDRYEQAVSITQGTERTIRFATSQGLRNAQAASAAKKMTLVINGTGYVASYALINEQQGTVAIFDDNVPALTEGSVVLVKIQSQTILQKAVGI